MTRGGHWTREMATGPMATRLRNVKERLAGRRSYIPSLAIDRANASLTRGCQRQALVFDAKPEYMMKMVTNKKGGVFAMAALPKT